MTAVTLDDKLSNTLILNNEDLNAPLMSPYQGLIRISKKKLSCFLVVSCLLHVTLKS